jgi:hypothetical protein
MVTSCLQVGVAFVDEEDGVPFCGPAELVVKVVYGGVIVAI